MLRAVDAIRGQGASILAAGLPGAVSIWTKPSKSTWHLPAEEAAGLAEDDPRLLQLIDTADLYISPGVRPLGLSSARAGKQDELVGLSAFGVDIDAKSPRRAHANLPETLEEVESILEAAVTLPSLVVRSGTGNSLHAWWIFDAIEPIHDPADLTRLKRASKKFHEPMHVRAEQLGFHLDSSSKLVQWLRLPGSKNRKDPDNPQDVEAIWLGREYAHDELVVDRRKNVTTVPEAIDHIARSERGEPRASLSDVFVALVKVAQRIRPDHEHKDKIDKILRGKSFAASGDRDEAMFLTLSTIMFHMDRREPLFADREQVGEALVKLYTPSFEVWAAEPTATKTLEERIDRLCSKIIDVFSQRDDKDAAKRADIERLGNALLKTVNLREDGVKVEAINESTTIIQHKTAYYVHNFGRQDDHPLPPGYLGPFMEKEVIPAVSDFWENCPAPFELTYQTEPTARNPEGVTKQKTVPRLVNEYGTLALDVIGDLSLDKSYFDIKTRIFHEAICQLRVFEPVYDKTFDEYLRVAFGDVYDKFVDYLSYFLTLERAFGAPYIEGPSGAGKGVLVAGLSRFWGTTGSTDYELVAASAFNAFDVPFIVLDEGLTMARKTSAHIRHLIATGAHTINPKGMPQYVVNGYVRVMFTANNKNVFTQITSNEDLSEDDIDAIARRFIYFRMADEAPQWLTERNPNNRLTNSWVEDDIIAKHVLWLNENHRKNVTPGKRFIVEGESSEVHRALVTRGEKRGLVLEWLAHFATNPKTVEQFYAVKRSEPLAKIGNGHLLVNTRAVAENWSIYGESSSPLTVTAIGRILGQISSRVRLGQGDGPGVRYHNINFDHVLDWAGGDAQVGNLEKMRENFNRHVEE